MYTPINSIKASLSVQTSRWRAHTYTDCRLRVRSYFEAYLSIYIYTWYHIPGLRRTYVPGSNSEYRETAFFSVRRKHIKRVRTESAVSRSALMADGCWRNWALVSYLAYYRVH